MERIINDLTNDMRWAIYDKAKNYFSIDVGKLGDNSKEGRALRKELAEACFQCVLQHLGKNLIL